MKSLLFAIFCLFSASNLLAQADIPIIKNTGRNSVPLHFEFDKNGNGICMFVDFTQNPTLRYAYMPSSKKEVFEPAEDIEDNNLANAFSTFAFDNDNNAHFIWTEKEDLQQSKADTRIYRVYHIMRPAGAASTFTKRAFITQFNQVENPRASLAFDNDNNAVLALNDFNKNRVVYYERAPGTTTTFRNPRNINNTNFVIDTSKSTFQKQIADAVGDITLGWNTSSNGTRYVVRKSGTDNDFSEINSVPTTNTTTTSYYDHTLDPSGNTVAAWGTDQPVVNPDGSAYIPVQISVRRKNSPTFITPTDIDFGVKGINVLFNIRVDSNNTRYMSMMNFNLDDQNPALLFTALTSNQGYYQNIFQPASPVFSATLARNEVEIPELYLNKDNAGALATYFIKLTSDSSSSTSSSTSTSTSTSSSSTSSGSGPDDSVQSADIRIALKPAEPVRSFGGQSFQHQGYNLQTPLIFRAFRTFTPSVTIKDVPYFKDGPNTVNMLVAANPLTGNFVLVNMIQESKDEFPISYRSIAPR